MRTFQVQIYNTGPADTVSTIFAKSRPKKIYLSSVCREHTFYLHVYTHIYNRNLMAKTGFAQISGWLELSSKHKFCIAIYSYKFLSDGSNSRGSQYWKAQTVFTVTVTIFKFYSVGLARTPFWSHKAIDWLGALD